MRYPNRWKLAVETSLVMFLCAAGLACLQISRQNPGSQGYIVMAGVPACAAACLIGFACLSRDLLNTPRVKFPYTLTLPIVFCSLLPVCALLVTTPEKGLIAPLEAVAYANLWQQPKELLSVLIMEVVALSLLSLFPRSVDEPA